MQNTKNNTPTKNYTLNISKEIGDIWTIKDINPLRHKFEKFFDEDLSHDISKITFVGATSFVLDILAGDTKRMDIDLRTSAERVELPGYIEFELVEACKLSAKYYVNDCPGQPQLQAWINASCKQIFREYPAFAYIKKM